MNKSQTEANKRWQEKNKNYNRYLKNRSTSRTFINKFATLEDLDELANAITIRKKLLKKGIELSAERDHLLAQIKKLILDKESLPPHFTESYLENEVQNHTISKIDGSPYSMEEISAILSDASIYRDEALLDVVYIHGSHMYSFPDISEKWKTTDE